MHILLIIKVKILVFINTRVNLELTYVVVIL